MSTKLPSNSSAQEKKERKKREEKEETKGKNERRYGKR